jgi:hypothetical protein
VDVQQYIPAGSSVQTLATMQQTEVGRAVLHALRVEAEKRNREMRLNPRINTEAVREDIRHKLGEIKGLEWLERLQRAAMEALSGKQAKEEGT